MGLSEKKEIDEIGVDMEKDHTGLFSFSVSVSVSVSVSPSLSLKSLFGISLVSSYGFFFLETVAWCRTTRTTP